ncbi:ParB/RepB/Spo0J family partition protein [Herbaspirillum huttiense]|uniref:ParB/RepB/Spo0J family partition protein n=1 Tax=Herbaspirillum huttiense TaxID=863372 RepID=UPI00381EDB6D
MSAAKKPVKATGKAGAKPALKPTAKPATKPAAKAVVKKPAAAAAKKEVKPAVKPAIKPAIKPATIKKSAPIAPPAKASSAKQKGGTSLDFLAQLKPVADVPKEVDLDLIDFDEFQPRDSFYPVDGEVDSEEQAAVEELAENIAQEGLHQLPVLVPNPEKPGRYKVGMGERRVRAFFINRAKGRGPNGSKTIPVLVKQLDGAQLKIAQLSENLQRKDLSDLQVARFLRRTLDEYPELQKQALGKILNKGSQYISRVLALLDPRWSDVVDSGFITYASLLEQYRALPEEQQSKLKQVAKTENRPLTSGDIRGAAAEAKSSAPKAQTTVGSVLSDDDLNSINKTFENLQVEGESYKYQGDKPSPVGQRPTAPATQRSFENDASVTLPSTPQPVSVAAFDKQPVKLSIGQLSVIANSINLPDDIMLETHLGTQLIKEILDTLGVAQPENPNLLVSELLKAVNKVKA